MAFLNSADLSCLVLKDQLDSIFDAFDDNANDRLEIGTTRTPNLLPPHCVFSDEFVKLLKVVDPGVTHQQIEGTFSRIHPEDPTYLDRPQFHEWALDIFGECGFNEMNSWLQVLLSSPLHAALTNGLQQDLGRSARKLVRKRARRADKSAWPVMKAVSMSKLGLSASAAEEREEESAHSSIYSVTATLKKGPPNFSSEPSSPRSPSNSGQGPTRTQKGHQGKRLVSERIGSGWQRVLRQKQSAERATEILLVLRSPSNSVVRVKKIQSTITKGLHGLGIELGVRQSTFRVKDFVAMPDGITNPGKTAKPALRVNDRILAVDGVPVSTPESFSTQVTQAQAQVVFTIERDVLRKQAPNKRRSRVRTAPEELPTQVEEVECEVGESEEEIASPSNTLPTTRGCGGCFRLLDKLL